MSTKTPESIIIRAIHEAFIKYPEGDGGPNLDYQWVPCRRGIREGIILISRGWGTYTPPRKGSAPNDSVRPLQESSDVIPQR